MESARTKQAAIVLGAVAALCPCALALNPALDIGQYAHTAWTIRDGFFEGPIQTIAQTPDGYLWLGTEFGLFRFDGVQKVLWNPPAGEHLPNANVMNLLAARDGRLWIGTRAGLASWKDNRLLRYPEIPEQPVAALAEDGDGTLWVGTWLSPVGRLCAIRSGAVQCYGQDGSFGFGVLSLFAENGNLWAGTGSGVWRWKPGLPKHYGNPAPAKQFSSFSKSDDGRLLIGTPLGLEELAGETVEASPITARGRPPHALRLLRDRNGGLWIATQDRGLLHVHEGRTDLFARTDGLSGDFVYAVFEDREGSIWVATTGGIDRFRDFAVPTMSSEQGLGGDYVGAVLAARDGTVWISGTGGLSRWSNGQVRTYRKRDGFPDGGTAGLLEDSRGRIWVSTAPHGLARLEGGKFASVRSVTGLRVEQIAEGPAGSFWLTNVLDGLIHLAGDEIVERIPWPVLGHSDNASFLTGDANRGGIWLGFRRGGILFFKDGKVRESYASSQGLAAGLVMGVFPRPDGSVWAATEGGFSRIKDGHVATLNTRNGLPCDSVRAALEDAGHAVWLDMGCGLVRISPKEFEAWTAHPDRSVTSTVFGASDGVIQQTSGGYSPRAVTLKNGQLWFSTIAGVLMVDTDHLANNKLPPPVRVERVTADGALRWQNLTGAADSNLRLPALSRDLEIDYTALSLVAPEKNRFKYKLEGHDRDWQDAGNRRQVFYNDLPPRHYRFRVIASNNSGVWNETGDSLEFSIDPAYYQTTWFYASCAAAFLVMLWGLYRLRLYQIRREFNAQLDGRLDERMRVARELHDTLLQSFQASLIQMQVVRNILHRSPDKAEQSLDRAITTAADAVVEGRSAIEDLRLHPAGGGDLPQLLTAAGQELAHPEEASGNPPAFGVTVEGERRDLKPLLQDEVYRIARELLRNAFRHAQARRIEVEIRYDSRQLRVHVRDDGKGIDPEILKAGGRAGHFGLPGIRERVDRFGGKLEFWSEAGAGTEAVLTVPAATAYGASNGGALSFLRRKLWIHER